MSRIAAVLAVLALAAVPAADGARRGRRERLLLVASPTAVGVVPAHPFVNAKVYLGKTAGGAGVDARTFRARLGGRDVSRRFVDFTDAGGSGKRAVLGAALLRMGPHRVNRLRVSARSQPFGRPRRRLREVHTVRFRAAAAGDRAPTAVIGGTSEAILAGVPIQFSGTGSFDPDHDWLTYDWDFGDGSAHATDPSPTHVFADGSADLEVSLTVSDGQLAASARTRLLAIPAVAPGRTPGLFRLGAAGSLELGAVPVGGQGTATITVTNLDPAPTSELRVHLATDAAAFTVTPATLDLGPGEHADVVLAFAPAAPGHQQAVLTGVASSANRPVIHALAHGFGGTAPGSGPTLAADPVFGHASGAGTFAIRPSGARVAVDDTVGVCRSHAGGGTQDLCVVSNDCRSGGESCTTSSPVRFQPIDLCGDGHGNLYLLSDTGTFTDPRGDLTKTESVLHVGLGADGSRAEADVFARTQDDTTNVACDRRAGGAVYLARAMDLPDSSSCLRAAEEDLVALGKASGAASTLYGPIDRAEGADACDGDFDPTGDLEVTPDGAAVFASFRTNGGIYRIVGPPPTPLEVVPGVTDAFQLHPDGAVLYAQASDGGTAATIALYKVFPQQSASGGALPLAQRTPCAVFTLPSNQGMTRLGSKSIAAGRAAPGSNDAVVLVSFGATEGPPPRPGLPLALGTNLRLGGTLVFSSPAGDTPCAAVGLMNVERIDLLAF
ncbi:MAG TPA: PKD domain-containing protein [Candidatus Binatia bacterium]|nr:PKD domain-containing protein [Candidatus Binatia bacterium]